jgi:hypothetical protein
MSSFMGRGHETPVDYSIKPGELGNFVTSAGLVTSGWSRLPREVNSRSPKTSDAILDVECHFE